MAVLRKGLFLFKLEKLAFFFDVHLTAGQESCPYFCQAKYRSQRKANQINDTIKAYTLCSGDQVAVALLVTLVLELLCFVYKVIREILWRFLFVLRCQDRPGWAGFFYSYFFKILMEDPSSSPPHTMYRHISKTLY